MQATYTRDHCQVDLEMLLLGLQHYRYDSLSCSEEEEQDRNRWRRVSDFLRAHAGDISQGLSRLMTDLEKFADLRFPTEVHTHQLEVILTLLQNWHGSESTAWAG